MAEIERTRERERPPIKENPYEAVLRQRAALKERNLNGPVVIRAEEQETFQSRQGKLKFFMDPVFPPFRDHPLQQWRVFIHQITTKSGRHVHQGGLLIFVLEGHGYSVVNGERWDWEKGDLVLLPLVPGGVEHQHFNLDTKPSVWAAFINTPMQEHLASDLQQRETSPDFKE
jgi:quercetin dioxygenase-like cupin family protein